MGLQLAENKHPYLYHAITTFDAPEENQSLLNTLWEKEKMLVTSIFSFFHNVLFDVKDKSNI